MTFVNSESFAICKIDQLSGYHKNVNCNNCQSNGHDYCEQHRCPHLGCNKDYKCKIHVCNDDGCCNIRQSQKYCKYHKCSSLRCENPVYYHSQKCKNAPDMLNGDDGCLCYECYNDDACNICSFVVTTMINIIFLCVYFAISKIFKYR